MQLPCFYQLSLCSFLASLATDCMQWVLLSDLLQSYQKSDVWCVLSDIHSSVHRSLSQWQNVFWATTYHTGSSGSSSYSSLSWSPNVYCPQRASQRGSDWYTPCLRRVFQTTSRVKRLSFNGSLSSTFPGVSFHWIISPLSLMTRWSLKP